MLQLAVLLSILPFAVCGYSVTAHRALLNPIISPKTSVFPFAYNPSFLYDEKQNPCLVIRCQNLTANNVVGPSKLAIVCGNGTTDLLNFPAITSKDVIFEPQTKDEVLGTEDPRIVQINETYYLFYTAVDPAMRGGVNARLSLATCYRYPRRASCWKRRGPLFSTVDQFQFSKSGALLVRPPPLPSYLIFGDCSIYNGLQVAVASPNFLNYTTLNEFLLFRTRSDKFDSELVESGPPPMQLSTGDWLFVYNSAQRLHGVPNRLFYAPGWVILNGTNPLQVIQRSEEPMMMPEYDWETTGLTPFVVFVEGMRSAGRKDTFVIYYGAADTSIGVAIVTVTP
jgi:predicted GH43/DUF377 family glycosyl hydrolase